MSTRQPDHELDIRDELDEVLDGLLTDADRDLHTSLERILDVDGGLGVVIGTAAHPPATRPPEPEGAARAEVSMSVEHRIEHLREVLRKLPGSRWRRVLHLESDYGLGDLHDLQVGLRERTLSRAEAIQHTQRIEHKLPLLPSAFRPLGLLALLLWGAVTWQAMNSAMSIILAVLIALTVFPMLAVPIGVSCTLLFDQSRQRNGGRSQQARSELRELRQAIARLFDDSHDGSAHQTHPR